MSEWYSIAECTVRATPYPLMGVKNLWKLLEPAGRPIRLESLEGLVLAVDISIWLNQAVKGMRTRGGEPIPNAHLIVLFHRICKLLYHRIKPVFVFDGTTPLLKQQTLAARHRRRDRAEERSAHAASKRTSKFLQAKILEQMTGQRSRVHIPPATQSGQAEKDLFELPPLPEGTLKDESSDDDLQRGPSVGHYVSDLMSVDIQSESFEGLPPDVQHELLLERQQIEKYSHHSMATLPQVAEDFSNYQLTRLLQRSRTSKKLEDVRKVLKSGETALVGLGEESRVHEVETSRIMGTDSAHYILVKGTDIDSQSSASQTDEEMPSQHSGRSEAELSGKSANILASHAQKAENVSKGSKNPEDTFEVVWFESDVESMSSSSDESEREGEGDYLGSYEGQLTLFEDLKASASKAQQQTEVSGDLIQSVEQSFSLVKDVPSLSSDSDSLSSDTDRDSAVKVPLSHTEVQLPPTVSAEEISASVVAPVSPADVETPSSSGPSGIPPSSSTSSIIPPSSTLSVELSTSDVIPPSSSTSSLIPPSSSTPDMIPPSPSTPDVIPPSSTPDVIPPSSSTSDVIPPLSTPDVIPPSSTPDVIPPLSSTSDVIPPSVSSVATTTTAVPLGPRAETSTGDAENDLRFSPVALRNTEGLEDNQTDSAVEEDMSGAPEGKDPSEEEVGSGGRGVSNSPQAEGRGPSEERVWSGGEELDALLSMEAGAAQELLGEEAEQLQRERAAQSRAATAVSNQMYKDAQELLSLFGLPYLVAPSEAEAQCATLEGVGLTEGSITDDNDVLLFGGKRVYRNFFSQDRDLEVYGGSEIEEALGLSREKLVVLAYLLGSDYTEGIEGVGVVSAMELLRDFPGEGLQPLHKLKSWHEEVNLKPPLAKNESSIQKKLRLAHLGPEFPSRLVWEAYMQPEVDTSDETFEWGKPDLDLLRSFAEDRIGWKEEKVNELLLPVLKKLNTASSTGQAKLTDFFSSGAGVSSTSGTPPTSQVLQGRGRAIRSKRLRCAITRIKEQSSDGSFSSSEEAVSRGRGKRHKPAATRRTPVKKKTEPATVGRSPAAKRLRKAGGPGSTSVGQMRRKSPVSKQPALSASSSDSSD